MHDSIKETLMNSLDKYSSSELTQKEIDSLSERLERSNLYAKFLDDFESSSASNEDMFIENLIRYLNNSISMPDDELNQILGIYFLNIIAFITDFLNTQNLKDKKKHIKNLKKLFIKNTRKIILMYQKGLNVTIDKLEK